MQQALSAHARAMSTCSPHAARPEAGLVKVCMSPAPCPEVGQPLTDSLTPHTPAPCLEVDPLPMQSTRP